MGYYYIGTSTKSSTPYPGSFPPRRLGQLCSACEPTTAIYWPILSRTSMISGMLYMAWYPAWYPALYPAWYRPAHKSCHDLSFLRVRVAVAASSSANIADCIRCYVWHFPHSWTWTSSNTSLERGERPLANTASLYIWVQL